MLGIGIPSAGNVIPKVWNDVFCKKLLKKCKKNDIFNT